MKPSKREFDISKEVCGRDCLGTPEGICHIEIAQALADYRMELAKYADEKIYCPYHDTKNIIETYGEE